MAAALSFIFKPRSSDAQQRFDEFIAWAQPGGLGGFNRNHVERYQPDDCFFSYSPLLIQHSHSSSRTWFVKQEWDLAGNTKAFFTRAVGDAVPQVKRPDVMISAGRFLRFAKAYLNIFTSLQELRSPSKPTARALIYLEKALRDLNNGDNDPAHLSHITFQRAAQRLQRSKLAPQVKYDAGKALAQIALILQGGGRPKGTRKKGQKLPGFNLIKTAFVFRSPIKSPPRHGRATPAAGKLHEAADTSEGNLTSEQVAAVGMAYRRAMHRFGRAGVPTFYAAVTALPLTTASMRASELQTLRKDALYWDKGKPRLRVPRPKIELEQDVPIPRKLGRLAQELFDVIEEHSAEPRAALSFYIMQSPTSHEAVQTLYIPDRLRPHFSRPYMNHADVWTVVNPGIFHAYFPQQFNGLKRTYFVQEPGDLYSVPNRYPMVKVRDFISTCRDLPVTLAVPKEALPNLYVSRKGAEGFIKSGGSAKVTLSTLSALFKSEKSRRPTIHLSTDDVMAFLLEDFKRLSFPHWPYATKDRSVRLDTALALHHRANTDGSVAPGAQQPCWWLPCLLSVQTLNTWIGSNSAYPPHLFALTDVRLDDGTYPTLSVHQTRRYHHTSALAAGANPHLLNQLAGRQSGWQAEAYDRQSPRQVLKNSIDTFDPDGEIDAIGPVADSAPSPKRVVDRKIFLMENAAPKHVHETGGCSSDWSLDPCHMFGDCMRCGSHVWQKGDKERLPRILDMKAEATRKIKLGREKLMKNPRLVSVANHVRQAKEVLDRCKQILRVESDALIPIGTIVTFDPAPSAMSDAQLLSWLRKLDSHL